MPYNVNRDSGFAERQSWIQVDDTTVGSLTGSEGISANSKDKRFASLVYSVNPSQINISGGVSIDTVGLKPSVHVGTTGGNLNVIDQGVIDAIKNQTTTVELSAVGINDSGDVGVTTSGELKVHDSGSLAKLIELNIRDNYSRIIEEDTSGNVYFAHAPIGTSRATSGWRIYKLDEDGNRSWADNGNFSQPTNIPLSGHTFSY